jgi:hypothetical protein
MAIPVSIIFCILVSTRTWILRGGVEWLILNCWRKEN